MGIGQTVWQLVTRSWGEPPKFGRGWSATIGTARQPLATNAPMIVSANPMPDPTVSGRGSGEFDAATTADIFITWLKHRIRYGVWTADDLAVLRLDFSEDTGIPTPRARVFLGAVKKHGGMVVRQDVRLFEEDGGFCRKATCYSFRSIPARIRVAELSGSPTDGWFGHEIASDQPHL